ncbi:hypothetical protein [Falsiroseomonas sp. HW251]
MFKGFVLAAALFAAALPGVMALNAAQPAQDPVVPAKVTLAVATLA